MGLEAIRKSTRGSRSLFKKINVGAMNLSVGEKKDRREEDFARLYPLAMLTPFELHFAVRRPAKSWIVIDTVISGVIPKVEVPLKVKSFPPVLKFLEGALWWFWRGGFMEPCASPAPGATTSSQSESDSQSSPADADAEDVAEETVDLHEVDQDIGDIDSSESPSEISEEDEAATAAASRTENHPIFRVDIVVAELCATLGEALIMGTNVNFAVKTWFNMPEGCTRWNIDALVSTSMETFSLYAVPAEWDDTLDATMRPFMSSITKEGCKYIQFDVLYHFTPNPPCTKMHRIDVSLLLNGLRLLLDSLPPAEGVAVNKHGTPLGYRSLFDYLIETMCTFTLPRKPGVATWRPEYLTQFITSMTYKLEADDMHIIMLAPNSKHNNIELSIDHLGLNLPRPSQDGVCVASVEVVGYQLDAVIGDSADNLTTYHVVTPAKIAATIEVNTGSSFLFMLFREVCQVKSTVALSDLTYLNVELSLSSFTFLLDQRPLILFIETGLQHFNWLWPNIKHLSHHETGISAVLQNESTSSEEKDVAASPPTEVLSFAGTNVLSFLSRLMLRLHVKMRAKNVKFNLYTCNKALAAAFEYSTGVADDQFITLATLRGVIDHLAKHNSNHDGNHLTCTWEVAKSKMTLQADVAPEIRVAIDYVFEGIKAELAPFTLNPLMLRLQRRSSMSKSPGTLRFQYTCCVPVEKQTYSAKGLLAFAGLCFHGGIGDPVQVLPLTQLFGKWARYMSPTDGRRIDRDGHRYYVENAIEKICRVHNFEVSLTDMELMLYLRENTPFFCYVHTVHASDLAALQHSILTSAATDPLSGGDPAAITDGGDSAADPLARENALLREELARQRAENKRLTSQLKKATSDCRSPRHKALESQQRAASASPVAPRSPPAPHTSKPFMETFFKGLGIGKKSS
eukprot:TRINITY_DN710_c1_g1_i14.p1 TRINITY_DN710_c1_g1~~TRINITY_DN710_c1_g1_i14.p1  ORF type:complete len:912 (-),score=190.74 TRINITY_DN710_c1_g1_i14:1225-3960(-)